jgi:hypothetical protein
MGSPVVSFDITPCRLLQPVGPVFFLGFSTDSFSRSALSAPKAVKNARQAGQYGDGDSIECRKFRPQRSQSLHRTTVKLGIAIAAMTNSDARRPIPLARPVALPQSIIHVLSLGTEHEQPDTSVFCHVLNNRGRLRWRIFPVCASRMVVNNDSSNAGFLLCHAAPFDPSRLG